jgi:hypothetical protein
VKGKRSSTHKRVVVRKLDKGLVKGFVDPTTYLSRNGVEVLDRDGHLVSIPLEEVKGLFFVREFDGNPQHPERKVFHSRPKLGGLWVRMTFKDNEVLEGLVPNNLLEIDPVGFFVTPPDLYSNNLKVFIPRSALAGMQVLGVIADGGARRLSQKPGTIGAKPADASRQIGLFSPLGSTENK